MPIRIAYEKRHHLGETDISYPVALCDLCGERITDAAMANYCWTHEPGPDEEWDYDRTWDVIFLHKECNSRMTAALEAGKGEDFEVRTPYGVLSSKYAHAAWGPMEDFPLFLGLNMKMKIDAKWKYRDSDGKEFYASRPDFH